MYIHIINMCSYYKYVYIRANVCTNILPVGTFATFLCIYTNKVHHHIFMGLTAFAVTHHRHTSVPDRAHSPNVDVHIHVYNHVMCIITGLRS